MQTTVETLQDETKAKQIAEDWQIISRVRSSPPQDPFREQFFQRWNGMIFSIVNKCSWAVGLCGDEFDDLVQKGFIGLIKAIDKFENGVGLFSTYAYSKIEGEIRPKLRKADKNSVSLDAVGETGEALIDLLTAPSNASGEEVESNIRRYRVRHLVDALQPRFRYVILQRFYHDVSLEKIGDSMGISKEAVRQTQVQALALLKERILFEGLVDDSRFASKKGEVSLSEFPLFGGLVKSA